MPTNNSSKSGSTGKEQEKDDNKTSSEMGTDGICDGSVRKCADPETKMIACIRSFENGTFSWIMVFSFGIWCCFR